MTNNKSLTQRTRNLNNFDKALQILNETPINEDHVQKVVETLSNIAMMRAQQGVEEAKSEQKIRQMIAQLENDTCRCKNTIEFLREYRDSLSDEEIGKLVTCIIKIQLGVSPEKL